NLFATDPITGVTYINPYPVGATTSGTSLSAKFFNTMTAGQNVYDFLNLTGNNSNSFTNCSAADSALNGSTATNSAICEPSLSGGTPLAGLGRGTGSGAETLTIKHALGAGTKSDVSQPLTGEEARRSGPPLVKLIQAKAFCDHT